MRIFTRTSPPPKPRSSLFFSSPRYRGKERLSIPPQQHRVLRADPESPEPQPQSPKERACFLRLNCLLTYNFQLQWR